MPEMCCVVEDARCSSSEAPLEECFSCGQMVCVECSSKRKYYKYGSVRLCNDCQVEYDGSDKRVIRRIEAGYKG